MWGNETIKRGVKDLADGGYAANCQVSERQTLLVLAAKIGDRSRHELPRDRSVLEAIEDHFLAAGRELLVDAKK